MVKSILVTNRMETSLQNPQTVAPFQAATNPKQSLDWFVNGVLVLAGSIQNGPSKHQGQFVSSE